MQDCPRCNSANTNLNGFTPIGSRRYRCRDCGKSWTPYTRERDPGPDCPECGLNETVKNGTKTRPSGDLQGWKCKNCNHTFVTKLETA
jgi:transposase-like protein